MTEETEQAEVLVPEVMKRELALLATEDAKPIQAAFLKVLGDAEVMAKKASAITVTDINQTAAMKEARVMRFNLKNMRVTADKNRKALKEEVLRRGKAIDGMYNVVLAIIAPAEEHLEEQEQFVERLIAKRKEELAATRTAELTPFGIDCQFIALGEMPDEAYANLLASSKAAHQAKIDAAAKAEADRIAKEKADADERARVIEENARLKREAEEREAAAKVEAERLRLENESREKALQAEREEAARVLAESQAKAKREADAAAAKAKKERDAIEAKAKAERDEADRKAAVEKKAADEKARIEREAREKTESQLAEKNRIEAATKAANEKAAKDAAAAPDKQKLQTVADAVRATKLPIMATENGRTAIAEISAKVEAFAKWIETKAKGL